jgi:hypothetical protein
MVVDGLTVWIEVQDRLNILAPQPYLANQFSESAGALFQKQSLSLTRGILLLY